MRLISVCVLILAFIISSCGERETFMELFGEAQGTTYSIKYRDINDDRIPDMVDSIFRQMDWLFSTYQSESEISLFNLSERGVKVSKEFHVMLETSWEVNINTDGMFDPTLAPVLGLYAYFAKNNAVPDSQVVAETLKFTGLPHLQFKDDSLIKRIPEVQLDLNGIAQGYTVDVISNLLDSLGVIDYMVEVGGELKCKGSNKQGTVWVIGVDKPLIDKDRQLICKVKVGNRAMATSGNYRKFVEVDGRRIGHIIDPKTGFPAETELLSASVFSSQCARADAYATAFMNMTENEVVDLVGREQDLDVILVSLRDGDTSIYISPALVSEMME